MEVPPLSKSSAIPSILKASLEVRLEDCEPLSGFIGFGGCISYTAATRGGDIAAAVLQGKAGGARIPVARKPAHGTSMLHDTQDAKKDSDRSYTLGPDGKLKCMQVSVQI